MTKAPADRCTPEAPGTAGTMIRDRQVPSRWFTLSAVGLLGLAFVACGGESSTGDDDSTSGDTGGTSGNGNGDGAGGTQASNGNGSGGTTSDGNGPGGNGTDGVTTTVGTTGSGGPGPVTSGTTSGDGAGGNNGSTDTSSGSSGGSAGAGGAPNNACEPQDVAGVGACDAAFGVFFLGDRCGWVGGCSCEGSDCDNAYDDEASCEAAHPGCFADDCEPQDITLVGGCEPASVYVFNGVECVAMDGCSCVGDDCDQSYGTPEECKAAYSMCADRALGCNLIEALYDDYVSHTACQDDSDCVMVSGHCGVGIGGCYHVVNRRWGQEGLDAIADDWSTRDCGGAVCDCATPPETVICDDGVCAFQE